MNKIEKILTEFIDDCKHIGETPCGITFCSPQYILDGVESMKKYLNKEINFNELLNKLEEVQNDLEEEYYYYECDGCGEGDYASYWAMEFDDLIDLLKKEHGK